MKPIGIYIHVPFCESKCPYCNFYSEKANDKLMDRYTDEVCKRIETRSKEYGRLPFDTLYLGGGTPSILEEKRISRIIAAVKDYFQDQKAEITVELNPAKAGELDFSLLQKNGVNRLSIGMQSANDRELRQLSRLHTAKDTEYTIKYAKEAGVTNISLDLMLAIPEQSAESIRESIQFCKEQGVQHVSAYLLKIEEGTPFYQKRKQLSLPGEESMCDWYLLACEELEKYGFMQYEISNFSKPHKRSRHNLKYWNSEPYLGIGPSAHSFLNGMRFYEQPSLKSFLKAEAVTIDGNGGSQEEYTMLRLRLTEGLLEDLYQRRFQRTIPRYYYTRAKAYEHEGFVSINERGISLTKKGFLVSNELIAQILL